MSSYKAIIILLILPLFFSSCAIKNPEVIQKDVKLFDNEDRYILYALEYESKNQKENARKLYYELFDNTDRSEYLIKFLNLTMQLQKFDELREYSLKHMNEEDSLYEVVLRFYTISLLKLGELEESEASGKILLEKFNGSINYELLANIYFEKEDYKKAEEYFESAYVSNINPGTLINLTNVLYAYLNKKDKAISYLETHVRLYGCQGGVCSKLYAFYREQKNLDGIISVLKRSYYEYKQNDDFYSMNRVYKILISYLESKNINEAIKFLEENEIDNFNLLSLYQKNDNKKKALTLLQKLYEQSGNIDLLAQIAILEFETAEDKKKVLVSVIKKFEDALIVLENHVYENFLGYLLIDYNIDIDKGLMYVKKALKKAPNNIAYMDSLAWGLYKKGKCKEAYAHMKKVVDTIGLDEPEIKDHWNKIKECKKK